MWPAQAKITVQNAAVPLVLGNLNIQMIVQSEKIALETKATPRLMVMLSQFSIANDSIMVPERHTTKTFRDRIPGVSLNTRRFNQQKYCKNAWVATSAPPRHARLPAQLCRTKSSMTSSHTYRILQVKDRMVQKAMWYSRSLTSVM